MGGRSRGRRRASVAIIDLDSNRMGRPEDGFVTRVTAVLTLIPLLAPLATGSPVTAGPAAIEVGQPFPDLVLPSLTDGRPDSIAAYRGGKIVLHVFASW